MSDGTSTDATAQAAGGGDGSDAGASSTTAASAGQAQAATAASTTQDAQAATDDPAKLRAELDEARREAAKYRRQARDAETERDGLRQAQMTDLEKAQERADKAEAALASIEARLAERELRDAVVTEATKLNVVAPADVYAIVRDAVSEKDADVAAIVKAAVDARPFLVRPAAGSGAAGNGDRNAGDTDGEHGDDASRRRLGWEQRSSIFDAAAAARRGGGVQMRSDDAAFRTGSG